VAVTFEEFEGGTKCLFHTLDSTGKMEEEKIRMGWNEPFDKLMKC
jgi:hypothetical protein